jgi:hypothetical protein
MDGFVDSAGGSGLGRTIDLRNGEVRFNYDYEMVPNDAAKDLSDSAYHLRVPVFNIEVRDHHTYYVGEWGVWVHNAV